MSITKEEQPNNDGAIIHHSEQVTRGHQQARLNGTGARKVQDKSKTFPKTDSRHWLPRLRKWDRSPYYSIQIQFRGRRVSLSTGTGNKEAAARTAAGMYNDMLALGMEATVAKYRGTAKDSEQVATVGEWVEAARKVSSVNACTFGCYASSLRKIAGDILALEKTAKRFGPKKGGATSYRAKIDAELLSVITLEGVQSWRLAYVAAAKNPAEEKSRMTTANSTIRQARSLFSRKIVKYLTKLKLPDPLPFAEVEFFPHQNAKYFSRIDPKALLCSARDELAQNDPPVFIAMLLALAAGLRRGEIDSLRWDQIDFVRGLIRVENTESATLKTVDSRGEVPIDDGTLALLRGFHAKASGEFVIEGDDLPFGPRSWGRRYRSLNTLDRLTHWLRKKGVTARKPLHELRKELGALVTAEHGIYAASRVLRHSNVATTAAHYAI